MAICGEMYRRGRHCLCTLLFILLSTRALLSLRSPISCRTVQTYYNLKVSDSQVSINAASQLQGKRKSSYLFSQSSPFHFSHSALSATSRDVIPRGMLSFASTCSFMIMILYTYSTFLRHTVL